MPEVGVEPTRPKGPRDFESRASANSATLAKRHGEFYVAQDVSSNAGYTISSERDVCDIHYACIRLYLQRIDI